jgi:hypothetical protein
VDRFTPYLGPVLESLVTLLGEVDTNGAKRRVISVLVVVIGASKERVSESPNSPLPSLTLISDHPTVGTPSRPYSCSMYVATVFSSFYSHLTEQGRTRPLMRQ